MQREAFGGLSKRQIQAAMENPEPEPTTPAGASPAQELLDEALQNGEGAPEPEGEVAEESGMTFRQLFQELQSHRAPWVMDAAIGVVRNPNQPKDVVPATFEIIEDRNGVRRPVLIAQARPGVPQQTLE